MDMLENKVLLEPIDIPLLLFVKILVFLTVPERLLTTEAI